MVICPYCYLPHEICPWIEPESLSHHWTAIWPHWFLLSDRRQVKLFTTFDDVTYLLRVDPVRYWLTLSRVGSHWNTLLHEDPTTPQIARHIQQRLDCYLMSDLL